MNSHRYAFGPLALALVVSGCSATYQGGVRSANVLDDTASVQAIINAGQVIPAGTFNITRVKGGVVRGSGRDLTILKELAVGGSNYGMIQMADHAVVQDLTLDDVGGTTVGGATSYTTVQRVRLIGGRNGSPGVNPRFALYYSHPGGGFSLGNQVLDTVVEDGVTGDDGFSFSYQQDGVIKNITHHGSRLALYHNTGTLVDGYDFTPTFYTGTGNYGLAVTASDHLTINNFHAPVSHPHLMASKKGVVISSTNINGMVADTLLVGDVGGLVVDNCTCGLHFDPFFGAGLTVSNSYLNRVYNLTSMVTVTWINNRIPGGTLP